MNAETYTQSFELTDALRKSINSHFNKSVNQYVPRVSYQLNTRIKTIRARTLLRRPRFMIELILKLPRAKCPLIVKREDENLYRLIANTSHLLRRLIKQKIHKEGKNHEHP